MKTTTYQITPSISTQFRMAVARAFLTNTGITVLCVLFSTASMALAEETSNLVVNEGFEKPGDGENRPAEGWYSKTAASSSDEQKHGGKVSLKLAILPDDEKKQHETERFLDSSLFKAGDEVEFSVYVKSTAKLGAGSHPYARLIFADPNWKNEVEVRVDLPCEPTGEWKKLSGKVPVPAGFQAD